MEQTIQSKTQEFLHMLAVDADVEVLHEDGLYKIHIKTESDASMLIGKHARMLGSIQRVLAAMLFKQAGERIDIVVDINDYRDAQKERLIGIADSIARRVIDEDRPATMTSFSPYERRVIHEHISQNYLSLETFSEGEGKDRRLVIARKSADLS